MKQITLTKEIDFGDKCEKAKTDYTLALVLTLIVVTMISFMLGLITGVGITRSKTARMNAENDKVVQETPETTAGETTTEEPDEVTEEEIEVNPEPQLKSLGEFKTTAYCPCPLCCGSWAQNRSDGVVYTASGKVAKSGHTVAADTDILPFGTVIIIDGCEYVVEDTGGAVKGNIIDLYFDNHEEACNYGMKYVEVFAYI